MKQTRANRFSRKKYLLLGLGGLVILSALLFTLEKRQVINLYGKTSETSEEEAKTTSTTETAQETFSGGEFREPGGTSNENGEEGGITDDGGSVNTDTDTSNPLVSSTGEISLYAPKPSTSVDPGYQVSGASTLTNVSYRLIDNVSGVIASGELSVVNGKFSGKLIFTTTATEGRLDLFATRIDGSEYSSIEVPLRFR